MKQHFKQGVLQLKQDVYDWYKGVLAVICYFIITNFLFESVCPMVIVTGFPCPGCGLTRAGKAFLTLHWADAWNWNCVIFLIAPFALYVVVCRYVLQCKCQGVGIGVAFIVVCLMVLYVYRMIYWFPAIPPMEYHDSNLIRFIELFL